MINRYLDKVSGETLYQKIVYHVQDQTLYSVWTYKDPELKALHRIDGPAVENHYVMIKKSYPYYWINGIQYVESAQFMFASMDWVTKTQSES